MGKDIIDFKDEIKEFNNLKDLKARLGELEIILKKGLPIGNIKVDRDSPPSYYVDNPYFYTIVEAILEGMNYPKAGKEFTFVDYPEAILLEEGAKKLKKRAIDYLAFKAKSNYRWREYLG